MSTYILPFLSHEITLERAGGKGKNLAGLAQSGFDVPAGFVITTDAYRAFVEANQIQDQILAFASRISPEDAASLETASEQIRSLFLHRPMPPEIAASIRAAYQELAAGETAQPVAVRSSATAEDLPGLAFAGQQDTYLNITGEEALVESVRQCWGSLWTGRALAYRSRTHIPAGQVFLAVVVQKMVASDSSGVLFTANPVTGRRDEMTIDASFGLGEALVSGQVEPDHYIVEARSEQIKERRLGAKEIAIVPQAGGGTRRISTTGSSQPALPDSQILALARVGMRVQELFGSPQDIEWALAEDQLFLLQARPITSLYPLPPLSTGQDEPRLYINFNAIQGFPDPFTPLGLDAFRLLTGGIFHSFRIYSPIEEILPEAGGRLFLDVTSLAADRRLRGLLTNLLKQTYPAALPTVQRLIEAGRLPEKRVLTPRRTLVLLGSLLPILARAARSILFPQNVYERTLARGDRFLAEVQRHAQAAGDLAGLLQAMQADFARMAKGVSISTMPTVMPLQALLPTLDRWLVEGLGEKPGTVLQLLRSSPHNVTTEMNLQLWAVAQMIRADSPSSEVLNTHPAEALAESYSRGELPEAAQRAVAEFLNLYGMRAVAEIDLGRPRWRDDPAPIFHMLQGYLQIEQVEQNPDRVFQRNRQEAEQLIREYTARLRKARSGRLRARLFRLLMRRIRLLGGLREIPLFYMVKALDIYRSRLRDCARQLVAGGYLEQAEDIFFVPLETLQQFTRDPEVDLKEKAAAGRKEYDRELARRQVPHVMLSTGEAFYEGIESAGSECSFAGEPVSPGVVEGTVRVVVEPRGVQLQRGEILVCPATDPGWTPMFLTAGGLVMEIGGVNTHGSVVAREYGLPAVVGVHQATTLLKTGQRVRVDGSRGCITVLNGEANPAI